MTKKFCIVNIEHEGCKRIRIEGKLMKWQGEREKGVHYSILTCLKEYEVTNKLDTLNNILLSRFVPHLFLVSPRRTINRNRSCLQLSRVYVCVSLCTCVCVCVIYNIVCSRHINNI